MLKLSAKQLQRRNHFIAKAERDNDESWSAFQSKPIRQIGKAGMRAMRHAPKIHTGPTPEALHWRQAVLTRDGHKCVWCGSTEQLQADHIQPKHLYPDLKYDIDNGRTLCFTCHKQTETFGTKVKRLISVQVEDVDADSTTTIS